MRKKPVGLLHEQTPMGMPPQPPRISPCRVQANTYSFYFTKLVAKENTDTHRDIHYTYKYTNTKIRIPSWRQLWLRDMADILFH